MKYQPKAGVDCNDEVFTPPALATAIVKHFYPVGSVLEPCRGDGAFVDAFRSTSGAVPFVVDGDFMLWSQPVDWIITNPPYSRFRDFLLHSMQVADNVVLLITINHLWTLARVRDVRDAGFALKEILLVDRPKEWPSTGFQHGVVHLRREWPPYGLVRMGVLQWR